MEHVKQGLRIFRDAYVAILLVPLWIWTILYNTTTIQHTGWTWVINLAPILSSLVFALGAFALWHYLEVLFLRATSVEHALSTLQTSKVWLLSSALFIMGIGALLQSTGASWGIGFVLLSELFIPVIALWLLAHKETTSQQAEENPAPESGL